MDKRRILAKTDHTLLRPEAIEPEILQLCDEALKYHAAAVCVSPVYVSASARY